MICLFISLFIFLFFLFEAGAGFLVGLVTLCFKWRARGGVRGRAARWSLGVCKYVCLCTRPHALRVLHVPPGDCVRLLF